ncbi:MAG: hypothetical protein ACRDTG_29110 [Pseudonocardiaceae bacterium]
MTGSTLYERIALRRVHARRYTELGAREQTPHPVCEASTDSRYGTP